MTLCSVRAYAFPHFEYYNSVISFFFSPDGLDYKSFDEKVHIHEERQTELQHYIKMVGGSLFTERYANNS